MPSCPLSLIISAILLLINIIFLSLVISGRKRKALAKTAIALSLVFSLILGAGGYYLIRAIFTIDELNKNTSIRTTDMSVIVLKSSPIEQLSDLKTDKVPAPKKTNNLEITSYLADIKKRTDVDLEMGPVENYIDAAGQLLGEKAKAMILNQS